MVITPEKNIYLPDDYMPFEYDPAKMRLSTRQLEEFERWTKFVQWGRRNPVLFAEQVFGLEFIGLPEIRFHDELEHTVCCVVL